MQDNLQDNVPETLAKFGKAGINTWVLTGDKEETAVNVGFATGMLSNDSQRLYLTSGNTSKLLTQLTDYNNLLNKERGKKHKVKSCLIVSGDALQ